MPGNKAPGVQEEPKLTPERVAIVLSLISGRLEWMRKKIERYHPEGEKMSLVGPGEPDLTQEELKRLWEAMKKFDPAMREMDSVLTAIMNKDGKI